MNEIQAIFNEYTELCNQYGFFDIGKPFPANWADILTMEKVAEMRREIELFVDIAERFTDKLGELEGALQPYGCHKNIVYTIGEYMAQGFTAEEAPRAQKHDILFNKWVNGKATPNEIAEMEAIAEALGL